MQSTYQNNEIEAFIESEYISIRDGESRILEFLKNREKVVDKSFNGKPTKKMQFIVVNPEDPERKEKKFELPKKHVSRIYCKTTDCRHKWTGSFNTHQVFHSVRIIDFINTSYKM